MHTILSQGMGVDSVAVLTRRLLEPETRPCNFDEFVVLTAKTGNKFESTRTQMESYLLPLIRKHNIRYVQVARSGPKESDGITVMDDSRQPLRVFLEGDYKLSDELLSSEVTPPFSGTYRCSLRRRWRRRRPQTPRPRATVIFQDLDLPLYRTCHVECLGADRGMNLDRIPA